MPLKKKKSEKVARLYSDSVIQTLNNKLEQKCYKLSMQMHNGSKINAVIHCARPYSTTISQLLRLNYSDREKIESYMGDRTLKPDGKSSSKNELNTFRILNASFLSSTTRGFWQAKLRRPCKRSGKSLLLTAPYTYTFRITFKRSCIRAPHKTGINLNIHYILNIAWECFSNIKKTVNGRFFPWANLKIISKDNQEASLISRRLQFWRIQNIG